MHLLNNIKKGKKQISVVLCILFMMTALTTATVNSRKDNLGLYQTGSDHLSYTFTFAEPTAQPISIQGTQFSKISMPGCLVLGKQAGDPTLPVKFIKLLLPSGTTVDSIDVTGTPVQFDVQGINLVTQPIYPYQNEVPIGTDTPQGFLMNNELYVSDQTYPATNHGDYHIGYSHGYAIFDISLSPTQYIPATGQLYYYPDMTLTINLKQDDNMNLFFRNTPADERWAQSLVSNPEMTSTYLGVPTFEYPGGLCDPADNYDYVIITTTQNSLNYWDTSGSTPNNWVSLMNEHNADGLTCTLVTVQDINACADYYNSTSLFNDSKAHIREFCKDAYQDWGTSYVLIGGDSDYIPARLLSYDYEGPVDSDIYWSNLDNDFNNDHDSSWGEEGDTGFDVYSELYIGRIVCDEPQDVSNWLTKSFFYADSTDYEYLDNAAFYGGNSGWDCQGDDFVDYGAVKTTSNYLGPIPEDHGTYPAWLGTQYGFETWNYENPGNEYNLSVKWSGAPSPNPGWSSGDEIGGLRNAINNDQVTLLSAFAHADYTMSCDVYDTDWEANYHNTKPFFVTDMGCHCGDFDAGDGILETMLFYSDTKLAFACTYNTGYGWGSFEDTNSSSAIQMKCFWDYFFDVTNNSQSQSDWQFGKGQAWSKDEMAPMLDWTYSAAPGSYRGVIECCLFFGDPAQLVKTASPSDPPAQPTKPVGQTLGIWNVPYTYTSSTTDPNSDQIFYLFDWGDGTSSGWLGPYSSGTTGTGTHTWTVLGTYNVKVKARDVWGAGSVWSEALVVTITDNNIPSIPEITGASQGKPGNQYLYNFVSVDLDGQNVYYFVDWGDNTTSGWLGPYISGAQIHLTHSWSEKATYTIKAKAKDTMNAESDWGTLQVVMPFEYRFSFTVFLQHLLEKFPNMFPVLRHLLGY